MIYEALTRKWRPKTFEDVVGQGHVTRSLANALSLGRIHHAYLFAGTRGVGKTTFARILARALNCERGPTATPCLECAGCREILAGASTDVQEIDGASHTGIDDVRRLRENAAYAPARLRYKIYIIDEVHMLSKSAFNGLLKILEEPPPHVVFVFATTEPNRIPETILSRVQRFDFRMLSEEEIRDRLRKIADAEGISCEEDALRLVARYAFGSMRDGQSLFEQAATSSGKGTVTAGLVEDMLGLVGTEAAIDLVEAVAVNGAEAAIGRFSELLQRGADLRFLFLSLIDVLRDITVWTFTGKDDLLFRHAPSSLARIRELAARKSREEWMLLLDIAFRSERDVLGAEFQRMGFELLLLRLVNAPGLLSVEESALPEGGAESARPAGPSKERESLPAASHGAAANAPKPPQTTFARRPPRDPAGQGSAGDEAWTALLKTLETKKKSASLRALLSSMRGRRDGDRFLIECDNQALLDLLGEGEKWALLNQAVEEVAGRKLEVRRVLSAEKKSPGSETAGRGESQRTQKALADPLLMEALKEFEGASLLEIRPAPAGRPSPSVPAEGVGEEADREGDEGLTPEEEA